MFYKFPADIPLGAVQVAFKLLKNNKASGAGGIPAEVLKSGGETLNAAPHAVFELWWRLTVFHKTARTPTLPLCTRTKEFGRFVTVIEEFRCLVFAGKVLASMLLLRLQVIADKGLQESQCGFCALRSTIDTVFKLRQLQGKCNEQWHPLAVCGVQRPDQGFRPC